MKKHKSTESGEVRFKVHHQQEGCRDLPRGWWGPRLASRYSG